MTRRQCLLIAHYLLLIAFLTGCRGGSAMPSRSPDGDGAPRINPPAELAIALGGWPALTDRDPRVPKGYGLVSESDVLRLYVHWSTSAILVEDRRNGRLWRSSPADLDENPNLNNAWRRRIGSPVLLSYVDADRRQVKVLDVFSNQAEIHVTPVKGGAQVGYLFPREGFELTVIYVVEGDVLQVTIPERGVIETSENGLVSAQVLPFLGATHDGEDGYLFFPDGSGTIIRYTSPHPENVQEISREVYGDSVSLTDADSPFRQPVLMPVFGAVNGDAAFLGIITHGDFDAKISVARSGKRVDYNHCGVEFLFRRTGLFSLTGGRPVQVYEPDPIGGDCQVRFNFLTAENASYVGMAIRYREYLIQERGAKRLAGDSALMHLVFFMGVERETWVWRDLIVMTTFDDVRMILSDLAEAGVRRVDVTLQGWNRGGDMARYPQRLPVETRLGGDKGLRVLAQDIEARGQRLFLFDDYLVISPRARGVFPRTDAVRSTNGLPMGDASQGYLLNPQVAMLKFAQMDMPKMADMGADGLLLNLFATLAMPDANDRYPLSREGFAATWIEIANLARAQFGAVAMTGGNSYAVPYADRLDGVPMDSTHYDFADETIPFYQIAVHGLVAYTGQPHNMVSDGQRIFLRQVEYGAIPLFVLTQGNSALLYRTKASGLWSSEYGFWRDDVIRQYQAFERIAPLINQLISDHTRLTDNVYQTTYEDGTRVIVNYGVQPYDVDSTQVPDQGFVVIRGD
jgi:hypothetical protein